MAAKKTFAILLSIIILVILVVVVVASLVTPASGIYDEKGKLKITDMLISSSNLGSIVDMSVGIADGDSQLVKIGKIFENFNPDLVYKKDVAGNRIYNKIIIDGDDNIGVSDVTYSDGSVKKGLITIIKEALVTWDIKNNDYDIYCPNGISSMSDNNLDSSCWDATFGSSTVTCTIHYDGDLTDSTKITSILKGKKTIRIMWMMATGDEKIYPIITVCGE